MPPGLMKASKAWRGVGDRKAGLLERLPDDAGLGRIAVEHARASLDRRERPVAKIGAGAELLDQRHDRAIGIVEQHRRGEAMAIDLVRQRPSRAVVLDHLDVGPREIEAAARRTVRRDTR